MSGPDETDDARRAFADVVLRSNDGISGRAHYPAAKARHVQSPLAVSTAGKRKTSNIVDEALFLLRPATMADVRPICELAKEAGGGMTSMPKTVAQWKKKIAASCESFAAAAAASGQAQGTFFMVLQEARSRRIVGTTGIYVGVGANGPFLSYRISGAACGPNASVKAPPVLEAMQAYEDVIEVGSLCLAKSHRKSSLARLLTKGRYLFLGVHRHRLEGRKVIAEIRGWQDRNNVSPFWHSFGRKVFGIDWPEAERRVTDDGVFSVIPTLPSVGVYLELLPVRARQVIAKPHAESRPAYHMLLQEGFHYGGCFDVFDAGPTLEAELDDIKTIKEGLDVEATICGDELPGNTDRYIVSNFSFARFRCLCTHAGWADDHRFALPLAAANALGISAGDRVRAVAV